MSATVQEAAPAAQNAPALIGDSIQFGKQYQEVPTQQIEELAKLWQEVPVRVQRRNAKGQLATLGTGYFTVQIGDLLAIEQWAPTRWGGGSYRCEVRDPTQPSRIVFAFSFLIEGMPIASSSIPNQPAGVMPGGQMQPFNPYAPQQQPLPAPGPGTPASAWAAGLHPSERAHFIASQAAPPTTYSSDQIAMQQNQQLEARLARMEAEAKAQREASELEIKRLRDLAAAAEKQAERAASDGKMAALEAKLEAMTHRPPERTMMDQMTALAPLVPLGIAWFESKGKSEAAQLQHQSSGFQAMIQAAQVKQPQQDGMKEILVTLGPLLAPLFTQMMNRGSPDEQAKLFQALADSHLNTISMAAQLVESTAPPPTSPAGAIIAQVLEGVKNIASSYMLSQGGLPGQLPSGPRPAGVLRGHQVDVGGGYQTVVDSETRAPIPSVPEAPRVAAPPKPPPQEVEALFAMLPGDFQSAEWQALLRALHTNPPMEASQVSTLLAGHLEHLMNFNMVPPLLQSIAVEPRATLEAILEKLPVASTNPQYAAKVLDLTLTMLMEDNYVPKPAAMVATDGEIDEADGDEADADEAAAEEE